MDVERISVTAKDPNGNISFHHISKEQFEMVYDLKHQDHEKWVDAVEHLFTSRKEAEIAITIIGGANNYKR